MLTCRRNIEQLLFEIHQYSGENEKKRLQIPIDTERVKENVTLFSFFLFLLQTSIASLCLSCLQTQFALETITTQKF
jgi:hypothetical protein